MTGRKRLFRLPLALPRVRRDVDEELRFHIEERIDELVSAGRSRADAEREVKLRFGDVARIEAECEAIDRSSLRARDRAAWLDALRNDASYAVRTLTRRPLFTAIVVLTLGLGIGANAAIFGAIDTVLLRPLPIRDLDRLVVLRNEVPVLPLDNAAVSPLEWMDLAARSDLFDASTAYTPESFTITGLGDPLRVEGTRTLGRFFDVFEGRPLVGRLYRPEDSENGTHRVVVLSHGLWRQLSGGDESFMGRQLEINGQIHEVIGVLPPSFRHPRDAAIWAPFEITERVRSPAQRSSWYMDAVARVRRGVSRAQLEAGLDNEARRWQREYGGPDPDSPLASSISARPLATHLAGDLRLVLLVLMGAVALVLLIACANVANLQLVRGALRARELAVRTALGAGRWAIARQLLVESVLLALLGGSLGIGIGAMLLKVLTRTSAAGYDALADARLHGPTLAFTAAVTVVAAILFGLVPALRASRVDIQEQLKVSARTSSGGMSRHPLLQGSVIVQMALALVLLLGSGLMVRSLKRLLETDPGFRPQEVTAFRISLPDARYADWELRLALFGEVAQRLRAIPGVEAVGLTTNLPFDSRTNSTTFQIEGMASVPGEPERHANLRFVSGSYFEAMGIPLLRGRTFDERDRRDAPKVVIIDEQLARQYFRGQDPIGRRIDSGQETEIIGVVASVKHSELDEETKATIYLPHAQNGWIGAMHYAVRSGVPTASLAPTLRALVLQVDPKLPVYEIEALPTLIERSVGARRMAMAVLTGFASLSLLLALLGVYGVLSYATAERTREIGVRMALGARPGDVVRMVLGGGARLAVVGLVVGAALFLAVGRVLRGLLYGVRPEDPLTLAAAVMLLAAAAGFACWIPARRASRVSPMVALRAE